MALGMSRQQQEPRQPSVRMLTIGSTRAARPAGRIDATRTAMTTTTNPAMNASGSTGLMR